MAKVFHSLYLMKLVTCFVALFSLVSALDSTTEASVSSTEPPASTKSSVDTVTVATQLDTGRSEDEEDEMEAASSDAKSKWDTKTQAIFKHKALSSLREKIRGARRREDKDKVPTTSTSTTTLAPDVLGQMSPLMPIPVPFDSIFAAASQASYSPPMFDPMAQYLPPPPSFLARSSGQQYLPPPPIYLIVPKHPMMHHPHHPYDSMSSLPNAFLAHMAHLHYDMMQQNNRQDVYDETDPRESTTPSGKSKLRGPLTGRNEKDSGSMKREEMNRMPQPDPNNILNYNLMSADKFGERTVNSILDRLNSEKKEFGYGERTMNHMIDRISDRSDNGGDKKPYGFGFPGREIESRENDSQHDNDLNHRGPPYNNEKDTNGNYLSTNTTPAPDTLNRHNDHPNDHSNDHHNGY